ncbi:uncharacterized protein LOC106642068 [Copidosoma floridanum]|uniref:uncharacterized protein LOC106642068 n=1 Tax=Copidosoma floridanum TaxID=29053 RepID=UPI0006C9A242|nr:uncharacterized protein LOC106642068 [Copidosoma floridanum]
MRVPIIVALLARFAFAVATNNVPVMLWCSNCQISMTNFVNPLNKISRDEFEGILKILSRARLPILVFLKDNFCVDDVKRHQQSLQKLNNSGSLTDLIYLPLVESALSAFNNISYNVIYKEKEVNPLVEEKLAIISVGDINVIPQKYKVLRDSNRNFVLAITGKSCLYSPSTNRIKRATKPDNNEGTSKILFHIDQVPSIKLDTSGYNPIGNETGRSVNTGDKSYNLTLNYGGINKIAKITLKAYFEKFHGYFKFIGMEYTPDGDSNKTLFLNSTSIIEFPSTFGYHCSQVIEFSCKNKHSLQNEVEVSVRLSNLQVQMDTEKFSNQVYDCVGFTSIPIWTGIFVTTILALILIWGLIMIIDIRTMDRFDDPKGKTITVSAQD